MPQLSAIDLLASGKTDKETAELLNLSRTCVTKWRLYDPVFQAALNHRRAEIWGAGADRLRALIPKALDALTAELENPDSPNRLKVAGQVLALTQMGGSALNVGPTDPEEIVRRVVKDRRAKTPGMMDELDDTGKGLPPFKRHMEETWRELEAHASEPDDAGAPPTDLPPSGE